MASRITLPFWPTALDCLSWSSDNIIAVAGGDQIGILTPRLRGSGPNGSHWDSTVFKANAFTAAELPLLPPLTFANFSPGEELSLRHVHALDWSPPGLARFRHCVLAVLSTNHVLSIWECDGKASVSANWKRQVIINHALISHHANVDKATGETEQQFSERKQLSQRVRAFTWSPIAVKASRDGGSPNFPQFLAVSTEAGDLIILRVQSPYDILAIDSTEWQVEIMKSFKVNALVAEAEAHISEKPIQDNLFKGTHIVADHITWGPWRVVEGTALCATLSFIARRKLYYFHIQTDANQAPLQISVWRQTLVKHSIPSRSDLTGPLKCSSKTSLLSLFAADAVFCVDTFNPPQDGSSLTSHHLDNRWDEVSGVAFTYNGTQPTDINIVSHLSSATAATTVLSAPLNHSEVSAQPKWQAAIVESKETFSTQHGLDGHVQERTWGIVSSPFGVYVATAVTLLPSDSLSHVIPSERNTIINIAQVVPFDDGSIIPANAAPNQIASEVLFSRLQRYLEQRSEAIQLEDMVQMLNIEPEEIDPIEELSFPESPDVKDIARHLRSKVLNQPDVVNERNITLARLALGPDSSGSRVSPRIIQRLVTEVINCDSHLHRGGKLSERIRSAYNIFNSKLNEQSESPVSQTKENGGSEICRICKEPILFESLKWARCASGHQFSRCALTFLSIQEPGYSKHCGICGVQILNEWKIPALIMMAEDPDVEMMDIAIEEGSGVDEDEGSRREDWVHVSHNKSSMKESSASLARILFAAFNTCIYCGGKFIA